ncbi:MAG: tRNA (adenosine(37)-N6)-dimethylallyltransferase MiaA [Hyphomicrobiaceae bacterium]
MNRPRAILIAGPTASGKSQLAMDLARARDGVIINADSMQVYRELRILTARPSAADEAALPHRLYGHVSGMDDYSVGRWLEDVTAILGDAEAAGRLAVIVGGTGLYFKALLEGLSPIPDIPVEIRGHWRGLGDELSANALYELLRERDPVMADRLAPSDRQRLVRALEVMDATGKSLAEWQDEPGAPLLRLEDVEAVVVAPEREVLYDRCNRRFDEMMEAGGLEEVQALAALELAPDRPIMRALGVRQLLAVVDGRLARDAALAQAKTETRRYAKRQLTWLRRNMIAWNWHFQQ